MSNTSLSPWTLFFLYKTLKHHMSNAETEQFSLCLKITLSLRLWCQQYISKKLEKGLIYHSAALLCLLTILFLGNWGDPLLYLQNGMFSIFSWFIMPQIFSMGDKSRLQADQFSTQTLSLCWFTNRCTNSRMFMSYINRQGLPWKRIVYLAAYAACICHSSLMMH